MATDTTVNELVINKLTQAQYDALTEKSPTELYFVTDANESIQVETLPIASADNLNKIYQYVGETSETYTNGSFYKCVENITITLSMMNSFISSDSSATLDSKKFASQNPIFADAITSNTPYPAWRADYQEGGTWNVWTQTPNLSITTDELASVWGITISGTPAVGDMIAVMKQEETTYAWTEVVLGEKLPDQTDNAGKFLTTDGTTTSWGNAISIKEQGVGNDGVIAIGTGDMKYGNYNTNSVIIGKGDHGQGYGAVVAIGSNAKVTASSSATIAIGYDAQAGYGESVVIGSRSKQAPNYGNGGQVTIGSWCTSSGSRAIVLGYECTVNANYAIQLGGKKATNSDANTFKVGNQNGNFEIMSADGTIPTDRYTTTPTDAGTYVPKLTIAEDGTATREWGTESGGGVSGDYLPLSGGTMTGPIKFSEIFTGSEISISADYYGIWGGPVFVVSGGTLISDNICPLNDKVTSLGMPNDSVPEEGGYGYGGLYYRRICTTAINNGASTDDIKVPATGGTMVVATPPTDNGTYVLKATVVDGVVTTEWVLEA